MLYPDRMPRYRSRFLNEMLREARTPVNKRVFTRLIFPAICLVVADRAQMRAQTSPAFTAVSADYFGCDPAVKSGTSQPASCLPRTTYTDYVDPNIGTARVTSTHPPTPTFTVITKTDGTRVQVFHQINAYYSMKMNVNPNRGANCALTGTTLLGVESLLGIDTYKYQQGDVVPGMRASNGVGGFINWLAPSLNCFILRSEAHFDRSPTTFQVTSNITLGTPPASAFDPQPGFVELSPMEAEHKVTILNMQTSNPAMTADEAEAAWVRTSATNVSMQRQEAAWRKQHGITQ